MIDVPNKLVNGVSIIRWEVWFISIKGLYKDVDDAVQVAVQNDFDPALIVRPVSVAIGESTYEVVF